MKKGICLAVVLLVVLAALAMAQGIRDRGGRSQLTLTTTKAEFGLNESVEFILHAANSPARLQGCYFSIEKQLPDGSWQEFYRSVPNPRDLKLVAQDSDQAFSWDRTNTSRSRSADQGQWRVKFVPVEAAPNNFLVANFILRAGGGNVQGQGALEIKCMRNKLVLGEKVTFRLENVGVGRANLDECYFVIQRYKNKKWLGWMTSPKNPFDIQGLAAGEVWKWDWDQKDGQGHKTEPGDWRIVFYAPNVPDTPVYHQFLIQ